MGMRIFVNHLSTSLKDRRGSEGVILSLFFTNYFLFRDC